MRKIWSAGVTVLVWVGVLLIAWLVIKPMLSRLWFKFHVMVGLEVGKPQIDYHHDPRHGLVLTYQPVNANIHGNSMPAVQLSRDDMAALSPIAQQLLWHINDKLQRYHDWCNTAPNDQATRPLSEAQFVLNRLLQDTLPNALQRYLQLARYTPEHLRATTADNLSADDMLIKILQQTEHQLDTLLAERHADTVAQLATDYRYVQARTPDILKV